MFSMEPFRSLDVISDALTDEWEVRMTLVQASNPQNPQCIRLQCGQTSPIPAVPELPTRVLWFLVVQLM